MSDDVPRITMFDLAGSNIIWNKDHTLVSGSAQVYEVTLNEKFCAILYDSLVDQPGQENLDYPGHHSTFHIKLLVLEAVTGQVLSNEHCWTIETSFSDDAYMGSERPKLYASGNYIFVCSTPPYGSDIISELGQGNILVCAKVDPESKTCKVRRSSTGLETILLAKTLFDEQERGVIRMPLEDNHEESTKPRVEIDFFSWHFLGFAFESVIFFETSYRYRSIRQKSYVAQTVFSVDLDNLLDMHEPSTMFSSVNFPLGLNVVDSFVEVQVNPAGYPLVMNTCPGLQYIPHYQVKMDQDEKEHVVFAGIIDVGKEFNGQLMPKIYSFRRLMEAGELPDLQN